MVLKVGETLGPYEIVGTLGAGGMATVYKGYHPRLDRYVAVKILHNVFLNEPAYVTRFEREAQIVARLEHPHIVPIYDFAEHNGQPYLVMKYVEGRTLKKIIAEGMLPQAEIVRVMSALAGALDYAHAQGVLHRDIKPSNILIDRAGIPYLTDFGLARIAEAGESTISKDMLLGTPQYVAPEQAQGNKALDARTDLYSFGVVLYEVLVGKVPFSADTPYAVLHDQIYTPLPPPTEANPRLSSDVAAVLLKALAKEPKDRYASAGEMVAGLENALTPNPSPSGRGEKNNAKNAGISSPPMSPLTPGPSPTPGRGEKASNGRAAEAVKPVAAEAIPNFTFDAAKPRTFAPTPAPKVPATKPRAPGRGWLIGGLVALAIFVVLIALNVAGAIHDAGQLVNQPTVPTLAASAAPTAVPFALYSVPSLPTTSAQTDVAAYPREPVYRIALARALWNAGQTDQARAVLDDGAKVAADVGANVAAYYLSAAGAARQDNAPEAAAYADIRALQSTPAGSADFAMARSLAGADLYRIASPPGNLTAAALKRISDLAVVTLALVDIMMARALISETRYGLAQTALDRLLAQPDALAEAHLVQGDLDAARGNADRAQDEWKTARQTADAPDWVVQQAKQAISSLTSST